MTDLEQALDRRTQVLTELRSTTWGPDVSDQGRTAAIMAYRKSLIDELKQLNEFIGEIQVYTHIEVVR